MSMAQTVARYKELLLQESEILKQKIDLEVEIKICQKEMELAALMATSGDQAGKSETEVFIEMNRMNLDGGDLEFLQSPFRGTGEVSSYTGIAETSLKRMANNGKIEARKVGGRYQFSTLSIVRYIINGEAEEET